jgi:hypothetical protein
MKRWLARICVFLLLGAIVNVAVAWGVLAARYNTWRGADDYDDVFGYWPGNQPALDIQIERGIAVCWVDVYPTPRFPEDLKAGRPAGAQVVPSWSCVWHLRDDWVAKEESYQDVAWGWPTLALHSCVQYEAVATNERGETWRFEVLQSHGGFATPWFEDFPQGRYLVPYLPIWPGFALNTVFYAVILWMLFAASFALRRCFRGGDASSAGCARSVRIPSAQAMSAPSAAQQSPRKVQIMRIINVLALISLLLIVVGCSGSRPVDTSRSLVGTWVHHDETSGGITAWAFRPDQTGAFISGSRNAGPVGASFTYSVEAQTVTITIHDRGPIRAITAADTLQLQTPDGAVSLRRATSHDGDPNVASYLKGLEQQLQRDQPSATDNASVSG